jgi:putative ABC transport system permease protein
VEHYLTRTGIPVNFGITVALGFIVGAAVAAQTFYIFVLENLRQFGALKAIGVTDRQILGMVLLQATVVAAIGYALGIGLCALFFESTNDLTALRGFVLHWQVVAGTAAAVLAIMVLSSIASIRRVFVLDPAVVFRG